MSSVGDLVINLAASVIVGTAVWLSQRLRRRRREARKRRFFGLGPEADCLLVAPRHASSPSPHSVHQVDVAALIEVATIVRDCGSRVELRVQGKGPAFDSALGAETEFCVGGPDANVRTKAHLRTFVPGLTIDPFTEVGAALHIRVGGERFTRLPNESEFVALAKIRTKGRPVFVLCGQTAVTNRAAARYLLDNHRMLIARHGVDGQFCVVLQVVSPAVYGDRVIREMGDFTTSAFAAPASGERVEVSKDG